MKTVYLDNNATTQVAPEVLEAMLPYFQRPVRQPLQHALLRRPGRRRKLREAREQVAALLGATPDEIIFTSCGTESDNAAIRSALATNPEKRHIVTSRVEHPAIRSLLRKHGRSGLPGHGTARGQERRSWTWNNSLGALRRTRLSSA